MNAIQAFGAAVAALSLASCGTMSISPPSPITQDTQARPLATTAPAPTTFDPYVQFNYALLAAQVPNADSAAQVKLLNEGLAIIEFRCNNYFVDLGRAQQNLSFARKETTLTGGVAAAMLGLANATTKVIANTGALFGFGAASMDTYQDVYLFSPDIKAVQNLVLDALKTYRNSLVQGTQTSQLTYTQVVSTLSEYEAYCQPHGIRDLVNQTFSQVKASAETPATPPVPPKPPAPAPKPAPVPKPVIPPAGAGGINPSTSINIRVVPRD